MVGFTYELRQGHKNIICSLNAKHSIETNYTYAKQRHPILQWHMGGSSEGYRNVTAIWKNLKELYSQPRQMKTSISTDEANNIQLITIDIIPALAKFKLRLRKRSSTHIIYK